MLQEDLQIGKGRSVSGGLGVASGRDHVDPCLWDLMTAYPTQLCCFVGLNSNVAENCGFISRNRIVVSVPSFIRRSYF